jgi:hypothetical protein
MNTIQEGRCEILERENFEWCLTLYEAGRFFRFRKKSNSMQQQQLAGYHPSFSLAQNYKVLAAWPNNSLLSLSLPRIHTHFFGISNHSRFSFPVEFLLVFQ